MIEIIRNDNGDILAVCEWYLVDKEGNFDSKGYYVWVNECEVNRNLRHSGLLRDFILMIIRKVPWIKYGYFKRRKYKNRVRMYSLRQWLKRAKLEEKNAVNIL